MRTYPAHEEGGEREWQLETIALEGEGGRVSACARGASSSPASPRPACGARADARRRGDARRRPRAGRDRASRASRRDDPLYAQLGLELGARDRVPVDATFATAVEGVFAAGDCVRGADLIVQAIADGREAARERRPRAAGHERAAEPRRRLICA